MTATTFEICPDVTSNNPDPVQQRTAPKFRDVNNAR